MFGGIKLSKKVRKQKKGKTPKKYIPKEKRSPGLDMGAGTKCRFCKRTVPLSQAWYHPNCGGYQDRYATAIDFTNNKAIVTPKEDVEIIEVDTPEVETDGES